MSLCAARRSDSRFVANRRTTSTCASTMFGSRGSSVTVNISPGSSCSSTDRRAAIRRVSSNDVNRYLGNHAGPGVPAKTCWTWNARVRAADGLAAASEHVDTPTSRILNDVIDSVADHLGNSSGVPE